MRSIEFVEPEDERWRTWRKDCAEATDQLVAAAQRSEAIAIQEGLYKRDTIWRRYYHDPARDDEHPQGPFFGKCAYCERRKRILHAEHYRPKHSVRDAVNQPVEKPMEDGEVASHPGYYWLAYDWQNLLPACDDCNTIIRRDDGYVGKGTRFPLADEELRAWGPDDDLSAEQPLLLNPCMDRPEQHLDIDLRTGLMHGKTERGRTSRDLLGLNDMDLPGQRLNTIVRVRQLLDQALAPSSSDRQRRDAYAELRRHRDGTMPFTRAARSCIQRHLHRHRQLDSALVAEGAPALQGEVGGPGGLSR